MRSKFSKKFFPFSPGIPWTIKNRKYIVPEIDGNTWNRVLKDKTFIITCYGGLLESFFSLAYCEAIAKIEPYRKITWMGTTDFEYFVNAQGIASINSFDLGANIVDKYPAPIFMDKQNNAYFNVLNNYLETKSYRSKWPYYNKDICLKQLYKNCMLEWNCNIPKLRNIN